MIPTQQDIAEFTRFQRNEITESILYERLASIEKDENNRKTLRLIAAEEKSHYAILKKYTGKEIGPDYKRIARFYFLARILGITFAIKLMESSEENAHNNYDKYAHMGIFIIINMPIYRTCNVWHMKKKCTSRS